MRKLALSFALVILITGSAFAAIEFPKLTGRVVDDANLLPATTEQDLSLMLQNHEAATGNQIVVVTLPSLQGYEIEEFGYQLGRHWGIGQKGKDNGVILIVAPNERKVRIEVGYGVEGILTDAKSSQIIHNIILPNFRSNEMESGVFYGATAILDVLGGKELPEAVASTQQGEPVPGWMVFIFLFPFFLPFIFSFYARRYGKHTVIQKGGLSGGSGWTAGGGSSGGFGGGFSGGGGGFGGGGGSGGW